MRQHPIPYHLAESGKKLKGKIEADEARVLEAEEREIADVVINCCQKRGNETGYDGFKKIPGTRIHVAADKAGLPISAGTSPANEHDSAKFIDVLEDISELAGDDLGRAVVSAYAGNGYDAKYIRNYLRSHGIDCCIHAKETQRKSHKTGIKNITARQGL